jgi:hypothetical protein
MLEAGWRFLEGPTGFGWATRGDTVPGIGRIDSIVRWATAGSLQQPVD